MAANNPCTICGKPGIPGLYRDNGKCQYHWKVGVWGKTWADKVNPMNSSYIEIAERHGAKIHHSEDIKMWCLLDQTGADNILWYAYFRDEKTAAWAYCVQHKLI
jgi:hypothetical protein